MNIIKKKKKIKKIFGGVKEKL